MGLGCCCSGVSAAAAEARGEDHLLINNPKDKLKIPSSHKHLRKFTRSMSVIERGRIALQPQPADQNSHCQLDLLMNVQEDGTPPPSNQPISITSDSEDEGGIAGPMDSSDDE
jgi:hypothetical protein